MTTQYPIILHPADEGGFAVEFPDLPAWTQGETVEECLEMAEDCLEVTIVSLIHDGDDIPEPSAKGDHFVALSEEVALKLAFYRAFKASGITKAELGRRLKWHGPQVQRLFSADHRTRTDRLLAAFHALGKRVSFVVEDADAA